jgi:LmbE family N-acetylglucosaminyl deacetylase
MMNQLSPNLLFRQLYRSALKRRSHEYPDRAWGLSSIVFSPHQDDETLGCGGTLIKKKRAGAEVQIVFMTDGSSSHDQLMPKAQLKLIRADEAIAAAKMMGIAEDNVMFLEFPDGKLAQHQAIATQKVLNILLHYRPQEIFVPYRRDGQPDHTATYRIVRKALQQSMLHTTVYEYPIWFWRHWPWTGFGDTWQESLDILKATFRAAGGLEMLINFQSAVFIGDVLDLKQTVLNQHQSQMFPILPDAYWPTLHEVCRGEFLECFFQDYEFFHSAN